MEKFKEKIKNSYLYVVFIKRGFYYGNGSALRSIFSAFLMAMVGLCLTLIVFIIKDMIFYSDFKPLNETNEKRRDGGVCKLRSKRRRKAKTEAG